MTAGWVLPRDWDAGRLLRFLTGLALLVLAFAANAGLIATPAGPAPAAPATTTTTVDVAAVVDVPAADTAQDPTVAPVPAALPAITGAVIEIGKATVGPVVPAGLAGTARDAHGSRAPPAV